MVMGLTLPRVQSALAGYVDTAGFLALQGLFTAHVTGNFVTLGASLAHGASGAIAKLLALPVFCAVVVLTRLVSFQLPKIGVPILTAALVVKALLLSVAAVLAITLGPFGEGDTWQALLTGMVLVSAMAIQNAAHRIHYPGAPPTTMMTGTTTQVMLDLADLLRPLGRDERAEVQARLRRMVPSLLAFAGGCAAGATLFKAAGTWCFLLPPILAVISLAPPILRTVEDPLARR
jgi:uncharacterized membrane protein YoaK (UPF0700 family)